MKIGIASDHHGYSEKRKVIKYLMKKKHEVIDFGINVSGSVDYPEYAFKVGEAIKNKEVDFGILFCGTGIGMSIAANKVNGVRCAKVNNIKEAKLAILHNDANCIAMGSNMHMFRVKDIIDVALQTNFSNDERHVRRNELIDNYQNNTLTEEIVIQETMNNSINISIEPKEEVIIETVVSEELPKLVEPTVDQVISIPLEEEKQNDN